MTARDKKSPRYSPGYEWTNHRGQVFTQVPEHPMSRKDGFYPRARLAVEKKLERFLRPEERVYHLNEETGDDSTTGSTSTKNIPGATARFGNLALFPSQKALAEYRSHLYHERRKKTGDPAQAFLSEGERNAYMTRMEEAEVTQKMREDAQAEERRRQKIQESAERRRKEKQK